MTKARDLANGATALSAVSATELGYLDGVTSAVQTQIDSKQEANANVSTTELGYLDGVTSAIQTQLDAKIPKTLTTTTGDIIYASGANTPARLSIGTTSQVLTVSGGVPAWATPAGSGGMTLLSTTTLSGATTTISIGTGYKGLYITAEKVNTTANDQYWFRFNSDSGSNYKYVGYRQNDGTQSIEGSGGYATFVRLNYTASSSNTISQQVINIPNYLSDTWKIGDYLICSLDGSSPNRPTLEYQSFSYNSASAISSITFGCMYNSFNAGTVKIYGVN